MTTADRLAAQDAPTVRVPAVAETMTCGTEFLTEAAEDAVQTVRRWQR